jgi:TonB family protein
MKIQLAICAALTLLCNASDLIVAAKANSKPTGIASSVPPGSIESSSFKKEEALLAPYLEELRTKIKAEWFPPKGQENETVRASFKVLSDGAVSNLRLSSAAPVPEAVSAAAMHAVAKASPFPALPAGAPKNGINVEFTFSYDVIRKGQNIPARQLVTNSNAIQVGANTNDKLDNTYLDNLAKSLQGACQDVPLASNSAIEVAIALSPTGVLQGTSIKKSSGVDSTDASILKRIVMLSPFAPLPQGASNPSTISLSFRAVDLQSQRLFPAIPLNNGSVDLNNEGVDLLKQKQFEPAIDHFRQAIAMDPNSEIAKQNLAVAYNNWGLTLSPIAAKHAFRRALFIEPDSRCATDNLAICLANQQIPALTFDDHLRLADHCLQERHFVDAFVEYQQALKLKPDAQLSSKLDALRPSAYLQFTTEHMPALD